MQNKYFQKSIISNHNFVPANYQIAYLDFESNAKKEAYERLCTIINKMNPDNEAKIQVSKLIIDIFEKYISEGNNLTEQQKCHEAVSYFDSIKEIFKNSPVKLNNEKI